MNKQRSSTKTVISPRSFKPSPRARAHPIRTKSKKVIKRFKPVSYNGSVTWRADNTGGPRSPRAITPQRNQEDDGYSSQKSLSSSYSGPYSSSNPASPRSSSKKLRAQEVNADMIRERDYEQLKMQLTEILEENSLLKSRVHAELKERHLLEGRNKELTDKLLDARKGLQETGTALFRVQQATEQLMNRRDQREVQLQRAIETHKVGIVGIVGIVGVL